MVMIIWSKFDILMREADSKIVYAVWFYFDNLYFDDIPWSDRYSMTSGDASGL